MEVNLSSMIPKGFPSTINFNRPPCCGCMNITVTEYPEEALPPNAHISQKPVLNYGNSLHSGQRCHSSAVHGCNLFCGVRIGYITMASPMVYDIFQQYFIDSRHVASF